MTLACYWVPMTSSQTSILWDAADYHRPVQNYLSEELSAGRIPFWTPYPWAGYPFLADPQVGAWYPLNWPFFLSGVGLRTPVVEHWLAALLACFGAYFLAFRLLKYPPAAVLAGLCYGISGFYVGNAAHTGVLQTAAYMPWLVLLLDRALESNALLNTILGGLVAGLMILAGHFQTTLYSFFALGLFATARAFQQRPWASQKLSSRLRIFGLALAIPVIGTLISAVATVPGLELTAYSVRAALKAINRPEGELPLQALLTLVYPNFLGGVLSGKYRGPFDITQYYYYAGILMVPLAIVGMRNRVLRRMMLPLIVVPIWYAMGRYAGLFLLIARLPGFSSVRAPVNVWFVASLGLAILAAAGLKRLHTRWPSKRLPAIVLLIFSIDLFYFQSVANRLAYSRTDYAHAYGDKEDLFREIAVALTPLTRFDEPDGIILFGPLSHFYNVRAEVTSGYGPLRLARYADYVDAMKSNPTLRDGLNVSVYLDLKSKSVELNQNPLPRANFPASLVPVQSMEDSKQKLLSLNQKRQALVPAGVVVAAQDANGEARVSEFTPGHYRIHYRCSSASVLRVGNAWFPGWAAEVGGRPIEVFPVDHTLLGVVVPAGEADLDLDYHPRFFLLGLLISLATLLSCVGILVWRSLRLRTAKTVAAT